MTFDLKNTNQPLVSIIVITYNSSKYVLDTLESAKAQNYPNIELILSDDSSTDNTVEICGKWMKENQNYFVRTEMITTEKNSGTAANCNRGLSAAKGEWLKFIAGDDMLFGNCINEFVKAVCSNSLIQILFSDIAINGNLKKETQGMEHFYSMAPKDQYIQLLKGNILLAPASFIKYNTAISLHGFNEKYPLFEDYPFFLKALKNKIKLYKINKQLVYYRVYENNISTRIGMNVKYQKSVKLFFQVEFLKELWGNRLYLYFGHYLIEYIILNFVTLGIIKNINTYRFLLNWLSPLNWFKKIRKLKKIFLLQDGK